MAIFDQKTVPQEDPEDKPLEKLVGEDKKFKTVEDLAKAKIEADNFIVRLQSEAKERQEAFDAALTELQGKKTLEEFVDLMKTQSTVIPNNQGNQPDETKPAATLTPEDVDKILDSREMKRQAEANEAEAIRLLSEAWGVNYVQQLEVKVRELGLDKSLIQQMARTNPKALATIVGATGKAKPDVFQPQQTVRSEGVVIPNGKDYAYYQKLRKENPKDYFSTKTQSEMFKRINEVGPEAFGMPQ